MKSSIFFKRSVLPEKLYFLGDAIFRIISEYKQAVIVLDGEAGAGKSTAAALLAEAFSGSVVHMDDFFLPLELRTPNRLAEPGGNVHYERFRREILSNIKNRKELTYGVYSCFEGEITSTRTVSTEGLLIVEGAYSLRPDYGKYYDISVFVTADKKVRLDRIKKRNGEEALVKFVNHWIPMEERYFNVFGIRDIVDFTVRT